MKPLCINCTHDQGYQFNITARTCGHPSLQELSLVDGEPINPLCAVIRDFGDCGREGKLFELKEVAA